MGRNKVPFWGSPMRKVVQRRQKLGGVPRGNMVKWRAPAQRALADRPNPKGGKQTDKG